MGSPRFLTLLGLLVLLSGFYDDCHRADAGGGMGKLFIHGRGSKHFEESDVNTDDNENLGGGCTLRINSDMGERTALLLKPTGTLDSHRFFQPMSDSDILRFKPGEKVLLSCPGKNNKVVINKRQKFYKDILVVCDSGKKFIINGKSTYFRSITCKTTPEPSLGRLGKCYRNQYQKYSIGFNVGAGFIRMIDMCFDLKRYTTLYTKFNVMKGVENRQRNVQRRNSFISGPFFNGLKPSIASVYNCKNGQYPVFQNLLGSSYLARRHINCNSRGGESLEKGHLAAYADFLYYPQQKATLFYVNTAPQWESFNHGNWKILEERIRTYAKIHNNNLVVFAGTYNVATLRDKSNNARQIFLARDSYHNQAMPVPEQLYRIVYDQYMKNGIVFLGINNIDTNLNTLIHRICKDVCEETKSFFAGWNRMNVSKGYIYCCTINDFLTSTGLQSVFPGKILPLLK